MRRENRNTAIEAVLAVLAVILVLVIGFWLGTDSDKGSQTTTTTVTAPAPARGNGAASAAGSPQSDPFMLAAISLATEPGRAAGSPGIPGAQAAAVILADSDKAQEQASQRAAYWSSVGSTIDALRELESTVSQLDTADAVTSERSNLQWFQSKALFAVGALEQMTVAVNPPELRQSLVDGARSLVGKSIDQANTVQAASSPQSGDAAARVMSTDAVVVDKELAGIESLYDQALEAAGGGDYKKANGLLVLVERAAANLG